eukprot:Skav208079  [mRNA]  locus=scaffold1800:124150:131179:- [translate_table: standard]
MSDRAAILAEIHQLQAEVLRIQDRLGELVSRVEELDFEVVDTPSASGSGYTPTPGASQGPIAGSSSAPSARGPVQLVEGERRGIAAETGRFFVRCLSGQPRGVTGQGRIRLQKRVYVVVRTFAGRVHTAPVVVCHSFAETKALVADPDSAFIKAISLQVGFLNILHLNRPSRPPSWVCGRKSLTKKQWEIVHRLERLSGEWRQLGTIRADDMGRIAAKQERQEAVLHDLTKFAKSSVAGVKKYQRLSKPVEQVKRFDAPPKVVGKLAKGDISGAQQILADRIKMDGQPVFDPVPFLNCKAKKLYVEPFSDGILPQDLVDPPPRVRIHATFDEKVKLLALLEESGRLAFRSPSEVVEGWGSGMFCVPKNTKVDRLILDGRPANRLQQPPNEYIMTMASAGAILGIYLKPSEKLLMSGDDLSNFFYTFKVNYDRASRNFLDWRIPTEVAKRFKSCPSTLHDEPYVYACLTSLAMGDSAACEYAQTSHLSMALQAGALLQHELLTIHGKAPRSNVAGGIIIDDFCLLEKVPLHVEQHLQAGQRRLMMHDIYRRVGLEAHPDKGFSAEEHGSFWGADINGVTGLVRGTAMRAASLVWVTSKVASLGYCSVGLLEVIAGGFVSLFTFRRRMLSLLDWVYSMQGGLSRETIVMLPGDCIDELWSLCILCPLAVSDLRATFCKDVYMVDASNWGDAVTRSTLPEGLQSEIHRHALTKAAWTKLLSPFAALQRSKGLLPVGDELPGDQEPYTEHPVWETAARGLNYDVVWKKRATAGRHINAGELRAYLKAEGLAGADCGGDVRVPVGSDSQVSLGATCKGRSASGCLNKLLQQSLPLHLGLGIYSNGGYVRSSHNPADDPTRGVDIRQADVMLPDWWIAAGEHNYEPLDEFLHDVCLSPSDLAGFPSLNPLTQIDAEHFDTEPFRKHNTRHRMIKEKLILRAIHKAEKNEHQPSTSTLIHSHPACPFDPELVRLLESFGRDQLLISQDGCWPPTEKGFLDIYSGQAGFAKASLRYGARWVLVIDINFGPQCDLLSNEVRSKLERLIRGGIFEHFSAAPICGSFSRAVTPAVRSQEFPRGLPGVSAAMQQKINDGNRHSQWVAKMVKLCISLSIRFWVENPFMSYMWIQPEWASLKPLEHHNVFRCDFCRYKTPWRKRTRFYVGARSSLSGVKNFCDKTHKHVLLRGRAKGKHACMTKLAEPYPKRLCVQLAHAVCRDLGRFKGPTTLSCRCTHRRIGEAKNPGPRRAFVPKDPAELDRVELIRPETLAIGRQHWEKFLTWIDDTLDQGVANSLWANPGLMATFLASYGRYWYSLGGALFNLRHLYICAQRMNPLLRGYMQEPWNVVTKWEELEPVEHRRPIPVALLNAMVVVALNWEWIRVAAVLMIAFYGCCRPGEVLTAVRRSLILPEDIGADPASACFLRILKPKPGRRGMGRVQHVKIKDECIFLFLSRVFRSCKPDDKIYPGSPGCFRTRWEKLLQRIGVPSSAKLTPGCLRAGGTVELYKQGMPIMDILWCLRLKNVETLQHYLQEISTEITMVDFPLPTRILIRNLSLLFSHFVSISCCETGEVQ